MMDAEEEKRAFRTISDWRLDPAQPANCPRCGKPGLTIEDRSARPYAEWYDLVCSSCGLDETLHIPLAPPTGG